MMKKITSLVLLVIFVGIGVSISSTYAQENNLENSITMEVIPNTSVTLLSGTGFNSAVKTLANNGVNVSSPQVDNNIQSFQRVDEVPAGVTTGELSIAGEEYPVYAWFTGGVLYYTTQAETIYMNESSQSMFQNLSSLTGLDLSNWNTSKVTNMQAMFNGCSNLENLNLDNWVINNNSIGGMFGGAGSLKTVSMKNWTIPENFTHAIGCRTSNLCATGIESIDVSNWDLSKTKNMQGLFGDLKAKEIKGLDTWNTSGVTNMSQMFYGCINLTGLNLSNWNTSKVTNMSQMFNGCSNLENLNLDNWVINNNSIGGMFGGAGSLKTVSMKNWTIPETFTHAIGCRTSQLCATGIESIDVSNWNLSNTKDLNGLFGDLKAKEIKGLDTWDTSGVTNMSQMFYGCINLTGFNLSNLNTSNVTNMSQMFYSCYNLTGLDLSNWNTSNVTSMGNIFDGCTKLEELNLSGWDFSKISMNDYYNPITSANNLKRINLTNTKFSGSIASMFNNSKIEEINLSGADVSRVTNMNGVFNGCRKLKNINLNGRNTSNVTDMSSMFYYCDSLAGLDLSNWNTSNVTNMLYMFGNCSSLENLNLDNWDFSKNPNMRYMFDGTSKMKLLSARNRTIPENFSNTDNHFYSLGTNDLVVDVSNWNLSKTKNLYNLFYNLKAKEIKGLDTWDTSGVTDMSQMFYGCSNLTGLDLSSFDTRNVINITSMFESCSSLENLNLSGWDFRKPGSNFLSQKLGIRFNTKLKNLNLTNAKFTGSMNNAFEWLSLEEIKLDGVDTRGVTGMANMFHSNRTNKIKNLDLSSFDTSNVKDMGAMFNGCYVENLNLSGWDFRKVGSYQLLTKLFPSGCQYSYPQYDLKKLDLTNAKFSGSMYQAFNGYGSCKIDKIILKGVSTIGISSMESMFAAQEFLTGLDLSSFDTSDVTNMSSMFYQCSGLTNLDLSNFDTSNVTSMSSMFLGCSNLENLNLDGWVISGSSSTISTMFHSANNLKNISMKNWSVPETFTNAIGCRNSQLCATNLESIDVSNWDLSKTKNLYGLFGDSKTKEIKGLDTWNTSNITNMGNMFYGCGNLTGLDLSNFNTSNVTSMETMFNGCNKLQTIYASDKFVTTALSGSTSSKDMFTNATNLVGGNGTKFDSNYTDKTYALIDKVGQTGYFTDKNAITVKLINTLDGTESMVTTSKGNKLVPPRVDGYHVVGGYLDENMTQEIDLNKGVDEYTEIYVKYEHNGSSGGGGGNGGGNGDSVISNDSEKSTDGETGDKEDSQQTEQASTQPQNDINTQDSSAETSEGQNNSQGTPTYSTEFQQAYEFAKGKGITTMPTIQKADMNGNLTRIAMAKMLSQYAINVLGKTPDITQNIKFNDVSDKKNLDYDNGVTLAYQLGIMGQNMPGNKFRPDDEVTRAEFATALSRMIYGTSDGEYKGTGKYYIYHMEKLVKEGIITKDDPAMKELRGYVMIMLMRSAK